MGLQSQLDAFKADFASKMPAERVALYEAKIEELRSEFIVSRSLQPGATAPDFTLQNQRGAPVTLSDLLRSNRVVITFYRGGWCPYCNIQLKAYQAILPRLSALNALLVAISPQLPDASLSTAEQDELTFDVVSDLGNQVARKFGLVYTLPEELQAALRSFNKVLPSINGDDSWELPVPATFVIDRGGRSLLSHVDVDYRNRLEPAAIIAALEAAPRA